MKIVVASRKGGVGKSTLTSGLASYFSTQGKRVLAIDLDPQSNLAFMMGADPTLEGTSKLLKGEQLVTQTLEGDENIHILAGGPTLAQQDLARLDPEDLLDSLKGLPYDVFLFDCPPGSEHLERLGIVAADVALVVTNAHPIAIVGAQRVLDDLQRRHQKKRKGPHRWSIVMNMIDTRRTLDKSVDELIENPNNIPTFKVKQDSKISYASACGLPLFQYAPTTSSALSIGEIGTWCLNG